MSFHNSYRKRSPPLLTYLSNKSLGKIWLVDFKPSRLYEYCRLLYMIFTLAHRIWHCLIVRGRWIDRLRCAMVLKEYESQTDLYHRQSVVYFRLPKQWACSCHSCWNTSTICTGKGGANTKWEFAVNVFRTLTCLIYVLTLPPQWLGALWGSSPLYSRLGPHLFNPLP